MLKIDFTEKAIDDVYQQFMDQPSGLAKKKLHVVYLKAVGLAHKEIEQPAPALTALGSLPRAYPH